MSANLFNLRIIDAQRIPDVDDETILTDEWMIWFRNGVIMIIHTNGTIKVAW